MKKTIIALSLIIIAGVITIIFYREKPKTTSYQEKLEISKNVYEESGKQIVEINAKGGYDPRYSVAQAETPTIIRVKTNSTFDCSSSLRIPSINYFKNLPPTGTTDIELPSQKPGSTLKALCSMGMYNFSIQFKS